MTTDHKRKSSLRRRCALGFLNVIIDSGGSLGGRVILILNKWISILSSRGIYPEGRKLILPAKEKETSFHLIRVRALSDFPHSNGR
jgi:hypothetical protein